MFSIKLSYLMQLTKSKATDVSKQVPISPSYLSRLMTGKRNLPKHAPFLTSLIEYFLKFKHFEFWLNEQLPTTKKGLYNWLIDDKIYIAENKNRNHIFLGIEGKQKALSILFEKAISEKNTIYLCSSDNLDWAFNDASFIKKTYSLLNTILNKNKIIVIHDFAKNYNNLFNYLLFWTNLYCSKNVEAYISEEIRDKIYTENIAILENEIAIKTSCYKSNFENTQTHFIKSKQVIEKIKAEFIEHLKYSSKLFKSTSYKDYNTFIKDYSNFNKSKNTLIHFNPKNLLLKETTTALQIDIFIRKNLKNKEIIEQIKDKMNKDKNYFAFCISDIPFINASIQFKKNIGLVIDESIYSNNQTFLNIYENYFNSLMPQNNLNTEDKLFFHNSFL